MTHVRQGSDVSFFGAFYFARLKLMSFFNPELARAAIRAVITP